jgi:transcriptional regulator with XRE-family HTH domain
MTFKRAIWYPIAIVLSAINLVAVGFAAGESQAWHAGTHAALALAFGLWAQRLRRIPRGSELQDSLEVLEAVEALEVEVGKLRQELGETQERLDFAERVLAQRPESRRMGPQP